MLSRNVRGNKTKLFVGVVFFAMTLQAYARCQPVAGKISETIISPFALNDPFGRTLGTVEGVLNGSTTATITTFNPPPAPFIVLNITTLNVFVTKGGDVLVGTGAGAFTPIPGKPPGEFTDSLTVTITGGTGKFAGATGTIVYSGEGHCVFGPGLVRFDFTYNGSVCTP
jgi:hypothetical protein